MANFCVVFDDPGHTLMTATFSIPTQQPPELLGAVALSADLVRLALDQLAQSVFLYRPSFDGDRIVDLEIIYCNQAALDLPLHKDIVPGVWVSEVFVDHQRALDAAQQAWSGEIPSTYVVVRHGVVHDSFETVRFEVTTSRAGDVLLQTSQDFTIPKQLAQSEARLRTIVQSLDEAVVLLEPIVDDNFHVMATRTIFRNERAEALDERIAALSSGGTISPSLADLREVWESDESTIRMIDNLDGGDPALPPLVVEIRLTRMDQLIVQIVSDHTARELAARAEADANALLATTLNAVGEGVGIFDPVHDEAGGIVDFVLCVANTTMADVIDIGQSAADIPILSGDPIAVGIRALQQPGEPITMTFPVAFPDGVETWRASIVAFGGQVVLVAADITEIQDALARVTASDDMLRTVLESLAESVLVFDADGKLTYANRASMELLGDRIYTDQHERAFSLRDVDGMPLADHQSPLQRGLRGEIVDDLVLAVERPELGDDRICRVAVRPIGGGDPASPSAVVVSAHDITETSRSADQLQWLSTHAPESGLFNRHGLIDAMANGDISARDDVVALWIRLSALDTIRPTFGFDAGDGVVNAAAERVAEVAHTFGGIAAHPTNNELVVVVPGDQDVARQVGAVLAARLSAPVEIAGATLPIDPAIGYAVSPRHGCTPDELLHRAKAAAWTAEREGGGQVGWRPDLGVHQIRRMELLGDIPRAISDGEIFLRYQPKFDVQTGHLVGAEALARWNRSGEGAVSPNEFIPAIEASGTAFRFTIWVIEEALTQWADVRQSLPHATLSVNVPGPLISDRNFISAVEELMKDLDVPGGVLMLEITERTVADSVAAIARGIERFAALGIGVSIDDFGTGQSSLEYLRRLRPSEIKVDRAFVASAGTDPVNRSVLKACIDIGRAANLSVCVEGVETDEELDLLKALGCTTVQGFLLARPGTITELLAFA